MDLRAIFEFYIFQKRQGNNDWNWSSLEQGLSPG